MLWFIVFAPLSMMGEFYIQSKCGLNDWQYGDVWKEVTPHLENLCSSKPEAFETLMKSWKTGGHCWSSSSMDKTTHSNIWCTNYLDKGEACIRNMTEEWQPYLNSEEKFITDFMVKGHKHTMEQLCKDGEDGLRDQVKRNDARHCVHDIGEMAGLAIRECLPKSPVYQGMKDIDVVLNKSDFCSNFHTTTKCIINYLEENCTGRDFSSFLNTIFESHYDWCKTNI